MVRVAVSGGVKGGLLVVLVCGTLAALVAATGWLMYGPAPPESFDPKRYQPQVEPTTEFPVKSVREAKGDLNPAELVLGVTVGGQSRAYPINVLNEEHIRYKVLNDTLGGEPVAASWCNLCHNGIVFVRQVDGQTLTLAVSGQLWKGSMVLYDRETGSLWSHLVGEARRGPLAGRRLRQIPCVVTDWETWCRLHPDSTVVALPRRFEWYRRDFYDKDLDRFVLGIAEGGAAKAWGFVALAEALAVNDEWAGRPVLAVLARPSFAARLYQREVGGRVLTFRMNGEQLTDRETGSTWEPVTGRATAGPLAGQTLAALPAAVSFRTAWRRFHPDSE